MGLPGNTKTSPQGGSFEIRSSSGPVGLVSEMHGVFSNKDLLCASGGNQMQPRMFWESPGNPDPQKRILMPCLVR